MENEELRQVLQAAIDSDPDTDGDAAQVIADLGQALSGLSGVTIQEVLAIPGAIEFGSICRGFDISPQKTVEALGAAVVMMEIPMIQQMHMLRCEPLLGEDPLTTIGRTMVYGAALTEVALHETLTELGAPDHTAPVLVFAAMTFLVAARMRAGG